MMQHPAWIQLCPLTHIDDLPFVPSTPLTFQVSLHERLNQCLPLVHLIINNEWMQLLGGVHQTMLS